jgi:hypothetical protein
VIGRSLGIVVCAVAFNTSATATSAGQVRLPGPQGDTYASIAQLPDWSGAWVIPFGEFARENGRQRVPDDPNAARLTPRYAEMAAAYPARRHSNSEACLPTGMPNVMRYAFAVEFLFTPGRVTILLEQDSTIRRVYTDGRPHTSDPDPTFTGESIGNWEGQTLIVDTTGISARAELLAGVPTSGKAHVVERIRRLDDRHLQIDTVIEDPEALMTPWRRTRIYERSDTTFFERICQDNNRDVDGGEPNLIAPK